MNNFKIFQICFTEDQLSSVHHLLTPFDNTKNERPELREYHNFMRIFYEGHTKDLDMWGAFGPRWRRKFRYNISEVFSAIEQNPGKDVYLFNHCRVQGALTKNVWEQGEFHHKGITQVAKKALFMCNMRSDIENLIMANEETVYSHYMVATNEFWKNYLLFLIKIKDALFTLPPEEKAIFESSANYVHDKSLNMFPFVIERMLSTYLALNEFDVYYTPYRYELYDEIKSQYILDRLYELNHLKNMARENQEKYLPKWQELQQHLMTEFPALMHIDG